MVKIYNDEIVKKFTLASVFWGVIGFTVGVLIAFQLSFPELNFEPYFTFGRLRPLHTSSVIFAFGGNVLFATSYFCVLSFIYNMLYRVKLKKKRKDRKNINEQSFFI